MLDLQENGTHVQRIPVCCLSSLPQSLLLSSYTGVYIDYHWWTIIDALLLTKVHRAH